MPGRIVPQFQDQSGRTGGTGLGGMGLGGVGLGGMGLGGTGLLGHPGLSGMGRPGLSVEAEEPVCRDVRACRV